MPMSRGLETVVSTFTHRAVCLGGLAIALAGCNEGNLHDFILVDRVSAPEWRQIESKRVFFGHQSVGENILAGIKAIAADDGANLSITELGSAMTGGGIVHLKIGRNEFPLSKIAHFESAMQTPDARNADIALMKFCFLDFKSDTDVPSLAAAYIHGLDSLRGAFPRTTFVAVTAPLTTVQTGPKAWIKKAIGRESAGVAENSRRQEFNRIIRDMYGTTGHLFDLAKIESEGAPPFSAGGRSLEVLNSAISSDGGHLNPQGERVVAAKLLKFIAGLPDRS